MTLLPMLISGGLAIDDRGALQFANDFDLSAYKRFYIIRNHESRFVRAWHAHKIEGKAFTVIDGAAVIGAVQVTDWDNPDRSVTPQRVVLSSAMPSVYVIPPGFANGLMTLQPNTEVLVFSTLAIDDAMKDDFRFDSRYWNIWSIEER